MPEIPHSAFWDMMLEAVGADGVRAFRDALAQPPSVSVRLNPFKQPSGEALFAGEEPVPGSPEGRFLTERPVFARDPLWHAGAYYVQDSSAMGVGTLLRSVLDSMTRPDRPLRVLDLCAAPGGKTTDAAASLRQRYGYDFLLVANELVPQRARLLRGNVALWGDPCVAVTSADPAAFGAFEGFFDVILADVPCSGEGMFRKDEEAVRAWSADTVALCAARQRRIVSDVWPALREGGVLLYSTCTFNRLENGDNVQWIASELGADPLGKPSVFVPGIVRGEGQYAAALRKTAPGREWRRPVRSSLPLFPEPWLSHPCRCMEKGSSLYAVPEEIVPDVLALSSLRPLAPGVEAAFIKGRGRIPSADLALSLLSASGAFPSRDLDFGTALRFLHRDSITLPDAPRGIVRVGYRGLPIGFVNNLGARCNNMHPMERRIRMDI